MSRVIRIGTRDSELALWQAKTVQKALKNLGYSSEMIPVKSKGDVVLDKPLYEFGITGIFTRTLDIAMLSGDIDIAVHSMKDVPTKLPKGIVQAAIMKRGNSTDILLHKGLDFLNQNGVIATGSLRRKAQWLHQYPHHQVVGLRGNVNTRLRKLKENDWNGAIFAAAGLERIALKPNHIEKDSLQVMDLDWMLPAPAQGAMLVVAKEEDEDFREILMNLNHRKSEICTHVERQFLRILEGGCSAPIGALAKIENETVNFTGGLFSLDGKEKFIEKMSFPVSRYENAGKKAAQSILERGGERLMKQIKETLQK
ncbi:MAG TPA: hydroxymethylbilane synthase [Flavobacteriaceae bacterium]|nr:hydroxymethylbilane synthase [Flavobacteriaceae bacterium]